MLPLVLAAVLSFSIGSEQPVTAPLAATQSRPSVAAFPDGERAVVWRQQRGGLPALVVKVGRHEPVTLAVMLGASDVPVITTATAGDVALVVSASSDLSGTVHVNAQRFRADGTPIDVMPFEIANYYSSGVTRDLAAASDGSSFVIAWSDVAGEVRAARIDATAPFVDGNTTVVAPRLPYSEGASAMRVLWTGSTYLLVWRERIEGATGISPSPLTDRIVAATVSPDLRASAPVEIATTREGYTVVDGFAAAYRSGRLLLATSTSSRGGQHCRQTALLDVANLGSNRSQQFGCDAASNDVPVAAAATPTGFLLLTVAPDRTLKSASVNVTGESSAETVLATGVSGVAANDAPFGAVLAYTRTDASAGNLPRVFTRDVVAVSYGRRRAVSGGR